ncbi:MAG: murein hydrolase activator EnvC [Actinomycetota bacterium]|nr:M23 family metallopeptidase [Actinomycetota bacterium]
MVRRLYLAGVLIAVAVSPAVARAADIDYIQPAPGPIIRHFEPPPTPYSAGHRGIDIGASIGTTVVAAAAGTVHFAGQVGGSLFVSIDHADGIRTTYSFLSTVLVRKGASVTQGQPIARSGPGGAGDARPNLHFGMIRGDYIDPEPVLVQSMRRNLWRVIHLAPVEDDAA